MTPDELTSATTKVEITEGKITNFYAMRNPDKLAGIDIPREISHELLSG
jgi:RNA polymerase sigma-70 factor (ECF subfamily)